MASGGSYNSLKESKEGSNASTTSSGSSAEYLTASGGSTDYFTASSSSVAKSKNDTRGLTKSSPAVQDSTRLSNGRPRNLFKRFLLSPPPSSAQQVAISSSGDSSSYEQKSGEHLNGNAQEVSTSSSGDSHGPGDEPLMNGENRNGNQQQADESRTSCCSPSQWMDRYFNCVHKIGNSCFIHIFQFLVFSVCASAIVMGIIFFHSCEGKFPTTNPFIGIMMGIFGLILTYMWVVKVCRERRGERYWNHDKNRLIFCLLIVLFFTTLEFLFFTQITPVAKALLANTEAKCPETYYDYLYCIQIVNGGFLVLAALLYLPDFIIYMCNCRPMVPSPHNGHYQPL